MAKTSKTTTQSTETTKKKVTKKAVVEVIEENQTPVSTPVVLKNVEVFSRFSDFDIHLFKAGKHYRLFEKFGSHITEYQGVQGVYFSVWAPSAKSVSVIGNFNYWDKGSHHLFVRWDASGIWEGFIPYIGKGETYKFCIQTQDNRLIEKMDPYAQQFEIPPRTASIVWDNWYEWTDSDWMAKRHTKNSLTSPMSVYEVHVGSWRRKNGNEKLSFVELADQLMNYVKEMGFTHVEFMPIMEHPYEPSWGYQVLGFFAPSSRFGSPQDFMYLVEECHKNDIGVILDWVPSHFPGDAHGLYEYDGTHLYEHPDMRRGYHPDWKSYIFNYGRNEIRSFLISNAVYWLERYHADGLRVDAVASMLYLDYSRKHGEWEPNIFGGNHNLEAISLFKELNETLYAQFPDIQIIAEESTSFSGVSRPIYAGGLGFGQKWMMGWMNDTLKYFQKDPMYRRHHQDQLTFSTNYAFSENFMLPLSHDEVVYGKKSLVGKMPGDEWQRFANLRLLFSYMFTHPGTNLIFMGGEFGQTSEWNFEKSLDWWLLDHAPHRGIQNLMKALNHMYKTEPALYEKQFSHEGFEWIDTSDRNNSIVIYARKGNVSKEQLIIILNMTPVPHENYRIGVPMMGIWNEILNSDEHDFGGSGKTNKSLIMADEIAWQGKAYSISLTIPPLGASILKVK
ncbi:MULTISPECIES: 1,4-alpha-glucan branching protein GlgB [unclassified Arcicella]|uniref:1,4-alpha-glucan branching protein GlgB n=1 Tax=unclassified Arcicella TaxID=2644986 RepID=UPI0028579E4F|nr:MULTISPECIES: 1,4-alpha-glucan branching protein GlgB [unclassified Arcicella]MDR6561700.1 1,4-alpha-glucan branching enzyme [Arcicella sp. BE51]MDR6812480.1 1,4-alpha-glucan branching enzyme [Arcicella sp. BE140]MDR6823748.1 1,4-alpha-glucan branching enzyme [Arcicella sp. BE139]